MLQSLLQFVMIVSSVINEVDVGCSRYSKTKQCGQNQYIAIDRVTTYGKSMTCIENNIYSIKN